MTIARVSDSSWAHLGSEGLGLAVLALAVGGGGGVEAFVPLPPQRLARRPQLLHNGVEIMVAGRADENLSDRRHLSRCPHSASHSSTMHETDVAQSKKGATV